MVPAAFNQENLMTMKLVYAAAIAATAVGLTLGNAEDAVAAEKKDIVDTAVAAGQFETLAAALDAAGLVATLKDPGPFTVFAPTDEAFANLPAGTVEALLRPENKEQLVAVLTYHVVPGKVAAAEVVNLDQAKTVNGGMLKIDADSNGVKINDANVKTTDIAASNGLIHVIDKVLLPPTAN
jgi:uncharacterized surface protein with fasciclin (FAS1) repeats